MIESLKSYIQQHQLFTADQKILLTVSGGIDSMVMLHLFKHLEVRYGVAHCNFQLRGRESDEDEAFVKTSVEMLGIPIFNIRFETNAYATENKLSIQMAARDLRYGWFEQIRKLHGYDFIATAHNADDSMETFFINLTRGCGLEGLTGIKPKLGNIIRPVLFASRKDIDQYARRKGVSYREDSSNASDKYLRNFIRHQVLPLLEQESPSFRKSMQITMSNLANSNSIYEHAIQKIIGEISFYEENILYIDIHKLSGSSAVATILWEILKHYKFNRDICYEIEEALQAQSGKTFLSISHRLVKDRDKLIITPLEEQEKQNYYIDLDHLPPNLPIAIQLKVIERNTDFVLNNKPEVAMLDYDLLEWPIILRNWKAGDYFSPLGMKALKKVSDFLIDLKISVPEKENTWILESGGKIVWIIGKRIDDRAKITDKTKRVLVIDTSKTNANYL